jgi:hypothetical protein
MHEVGELFIELGDGVIEDFKLLIGETLGS